MKIKFKVWFARFRALLWTVATIVTLKWFPDSIVYVIIASGYANVFTDLSVAEAADDRILIDALEEIKAQLAELRRES